MDTKIKPLKLKIVTPFGIKFDSDEKPNLIIDSIVARGVIPSKGNFANLSGDAIFDFEILPDHTPFVAKVSQKSLIRVITKSGELVFNTENGGVVTVSHSDDRTIAYFTMQDIIEPTTNKNNVSGG